MKDLISVETGRYVNVQSMIFKFVYERSPLFTEQVLVIPIILVFFGEYLLLYMWVIFSSVSNAVYLIPEESDDRMGFLTTNTLTMFVLLTLISDMIPSTPRKGYKVIPKPLKRSIISIRSKCCRSPNAPHAVSIINRAFCIAVCYRLKKFYVSQI